MRLLSLALFAAMSVGVSSQPFSCYPRMRDQPSIKPFERQMPEVPRNRIPYQSPVALPLTEEQAASAANPVIPTPQAISLGRIYYGYYCAMCHGAQGRGEGSVGVSYVPMASDLTASEALGESDGELAYAMVSGEGHEPVLEATVPLARRWHIVLYLRSLSAARHSERGAAPRGPAGRPTQPVLRGAGRVSP